MVIAYSSEIIEGLSALFFIFDIELEMHWFVIGEAIIGFHPLTNASITLLFLRPYRRAFKRLFPQLNRGMWKSGKTRYDSIHSQRHPNGYKPDRSSSVVKDNGGLAVDSIADDYTSTICRSNAGSGNNLEKWDSGTEIQL